MTNLALVMNLKEVWKWNTRLSAVYALGIWTMVGSYAYFRYTGRLKDTPVKEEVQEPEDPTKVVYLSDHSKTVIVYKKDFVPYSTRIFNFFNFKSFSSQPGSGDGDK